MLALALFVFFVGCTKDEFHEVAAVEELYNYETLDAWLDASKDDVLNNLTQLGFVEDSEYSYSYEGMEAGLYRLLSGNVEYYITLVTKDAAIMRISMAKDMPASSYRNFVATIDRLVQQERAFYSDQEIVGGSGYFAWDDTPDEYGAIDGDAEFSSYDEFLTALSSVEHANLHMASWVDVYPNVSAGIFPADYDVMESNRQIVSIVVGRSSL